MGVIWWICKRFAGNGLYIMQNGLFADGCVVCKWLKMSDKECYVYNLVIRVVLLFGCNQVRLLWFGC